MVQTFEDFVVKNLKSYAGNTTKAVAFSIVDPSIPENLNGATIKMWIVKPGTFTPAKVLSTEDATIQISDPDLGQFVLMPFLCDIPAGCYEYDIKISYAGGQVKTWFTGDYEICNTRTKC